MTALMSPEEQLRIVVDELTHSNSAYGPIGDEGSEATRRRRIRAVIDARIPFLNTTQREKLAANVWAELYGLGALDPLLTDPLVAEVLVNPSGSVWIEKAGSLRTTAVHLPAERVEQLIERILAPLGQRVDRLHPYVDARLPDGSRVHAIIPPISVDGPALTIRRFSTKQLSLESFATPDQSEILANLVRERRSLVVCGGTGTGKTTLLNTLTSFIPEAERVVTIEDTAELRLANRHVVRLEARVASSEGLGEVTMRELVRTSLRMRPDRIVVGEVRGPEALDMVQAMSTGHHGSLSTIHADSALQALARLELLIMLGRAGLDSQTVRAQINMAVDVVVSVKRSSDGIRAVHDIAKVDLAHGDWILTPVSTV